MVQAHSGEQYQPEYPRVHTWGLYYLSFIINDITEKIRSNIKLFADDTLLYVTIDGDAEDATEQLNDDLLQVSQWAEN